MLITFRRVGIAICGFALVGLAGTRGWNQWQAPHNRHGKYNAIEALRVAAPICRTLLPDESELTFSARADSVSTLQGVKHVWSIYCEDPQGKTRAFLMMDAATGEPFAISDTSTRRPPEPIRLITRREAGQAAKSWMRSLGVSRTAPYWKLISEPLKTSRAWLFTWRAEDRTARVLVDARTGDLITVGVTRHALSSHGDLNRRGAVYRSRGET